MKVACLLAEGFEDSEFQKPYEEFKDAGHSVMVIGLEKGIEVKGKKGNVSTKTDLGIEEVSANTYDALFIPGGYSPEMLRTNQNVIGFTREFFTSGKPVFAICHGPQLLASANVLKGYKLTAWQTVQDDLKKMGYNVVDEEVVVDRNLVTSRKPEDIPAFIEKSLGLISKVPAGVS